MWIPRPAYEAVPYVLAAAGTAMIAIALLVQRGPRGLLFGFGGFAIIVGLVLWMKRRDYRATQSHYDPHSLDN